ncbi:YceI family protein [Paenibacillus sp. PL91]|uniref:YceI family protein n=1 Tax=Paenibacillus sp. PL91 TaxID=2729538 RepID=UPI00145D801D|nr:YceI family protein [Paenibacillus sp. PL91]MBC9203387.1 YceI family protein [Paenibacillus sp. PL91]
MKKKGIVLIASSIGVVALIGGFIAYDYFVGNRVEIQEVIPASAPAQAASVDVSADALNGTWSIAQPSNVYFSVKTSKEEVNFSMNAVEGSWLVDLENPSVMSGEGVVDLASVTSDNPTRDSHIKEAKFLDVANYPDASFKVKSFENVKSDWKEGETVPLTIAGTLEVKGQTKDVTFASQALYSDNTLKLSGTTTVQFSDFGMENPHTVVLDTENDLTVRLELNLEKQSL